MGVSSPERTLPPRPVLTVPEVAEYLGEPVSRVLKRLRRGNLPGEKFGGRWEVRRGALLAWERGDAATPAPEPRRQVVTRGGQRGA